MQPQRVIYDSSVKVTKTVNHIVDMNIKTTNDKRAFMAIFLTDKPFGNVKEADQ